MLVSALVGAAILMAAVGYVIFRKFTFTRQEIQFGAPQDGVSAIHLDIREDTVRSIRIIYVDGRVSEVRTLQAA
jgi:hypothetical protein